MKKSIILMVVAIFAICITSTAFAGPFADVPANNWAYSAVNQLAKAGLIDGYNDGTFRGDKTITRYEMAIIIGKALEHADKADVANKTLLDKLSNEYAQELKALGVRMSTIEHKVDRVQFSGSNQLWYRSTNDGATPKAPFAGRTSYGDNQFLLNVNVKVQDNISAFARFGERSFFGASSNHQFSNNDGGLSTSNLDHFGVKVKIGTWDLSMGRQAVMLGQGSIINTGSEFGFNPQFQGLVASTKVNNVTMHAIAGNTNANENTDYMTGSTYKGANWFGADASIQVNKNIRLGAAYAHEKYINNYLSARGYNALNATINFGGRFTLTAETVKSNADTLNKAWQLTGVYHQNKDTLVWMHANTQKNAIDQYTNIQQGGYQFALGASLADYPEWSGNLYKWMHDLTPAVQSTVMVITDSVKGNPGKNIEWVGGFLFKF